jgi:hypothetical protein
MKIVTSHVFPPIPYRGDDWEAFEEGQEENQEYGYGKTEAEAIQNFKDNYGE